MNEIGESIEKLQDVMRALRIAEAAASRLRAEREDALRRAEWHESHGSEAAKSLTRVAAALGFCPCCGGDKIHWGDCHLAVALGMEVKTAVPIFHRHPECSNGIEHEADEEMEQ